MSKLLEEIKRHIEYTNAMEQKSVRDLQLEELYKLYIEQQDRINKAIEYIEENTFSSYDRETNLYKDVIFEEEIMKILKGE